MLLASIQDQANRFPQQTALQATQIGLSYAEMMSAIQLAAECLQAQTVHCLALSLDNTPAWVVWDLAALTSQMTNVPIPAFFLHHKNNMP